MVMFTPNWANSTGGSPYSLSKAHLAPLLSANHHSASCTLTTNQPWVTGVSPDPKSSSCARGMDPILAPRAGSPGSCIESEYDLVRFLVAPMSEPAPLAHDAKTALRQHTYRRGVVARGASVKR